MSEKSKKKSNGNTKKAPVKKPKALKATAEKKVRPVKRKPTKKGKLPYVIYITPNLKAKLKAYAKKKDLYLTDIGEALLSRGLRAN